MTRETGGADITPPVPPVSKLRRGKPVRSRLPGDMEALNEGWNRLSKEEAQDALKFFTQAASSPDKLLSLEAMLGQAYSQWRLGNNAQAEALFMSLVDQQFRVPEVLPNLLFLLRKRGGPQAVEPYLRYLPEADRDIWRK